ncbi:rhamnosyltransferase WsaF family glycosyltransferase [Actinoplanes xinjiangensis]|uniref:rhamnosyltransferase WsaF family glycosyltransferase n=1 Tax=Actinoplanes xinjiangensis TaxID=512350 RepID=UPI00341494B3
MNLLGSARQREALKVLRESGPRGLAQRMVRVAYHRLSASDLEAPLDFDHIADSQGLRLTVPAQRPARGTPLTVGWLCTPPRPGSGGHTTLFRMVEGLEAAGHQCVLYIHDVFHGELARHEAVIRDGWPGMKAEIRSVSDGLGPLDAYVASGWESAHVLASYPDVPTRRLYFVQDYEPWFYPAGSQYVLAEDTYRFGFRPITVGPMLADLLREKFGTEAAVAEFGVDTAVYQLTNREKRRGVVFYTKRDYARRGFALGLVALREFHRRHPDHEIHLFGDATVRAPFPAVNHGTVRPAQLSELYNECAAGLAMSFTNLSLVPDEMLACGVIPIVGESEHAKASIDNPYIRWVRPTPVALADALSAAVTDGPAPASIAASIRQTPWGTAQRVTLETIEDEVYG